MMDQFENLSPLDYRYWDPNVARYLSEKAFVKYKLKVELALVRALTKRQVCSQEVLNEIEHACAQITVQDVYQEERRVKHDLRALVNCLRHRVSDPSKPYVHLSATSYDISDTANILRYRDVIVEVLIPELLKLEEALILLTLREANTVQIGRTHGQHAVPITFGFAIANYVSRLGQAIQSLTGLTAMLQGKFSGAVGAYNASTLLVDDPEQFEAEILADLGCEPAEVSSQVIPAESRMRVFSELVLICGIMADLSDDMRHLQRTEIGEVAEVFENDQVGSSTMPQKRNPINFENAKSLWKVVLPRLLTVFMDQLSEHQRDLTNSASARTYGEMIAYVVSTAQRLAGVMSRLQVDKQQVQKNLALQEGMILAEPLYVVLSSLGHPDAHEIVRKLTLKAQAEDKQLLSVFEDDHTLASYRERMTEKQQQIFRDCGFYSGIAAEKARKVAMRWKKEFRL